MASETYEFFKNLSNGQEINRWSYPDKLIYDVRQIRGSNSIKVVITFDDDDDFLDVLGLEEDQEDRYTWRRYTGGYYNDDWDSYRYEEDWREGYILQNFNNENVELVNEILKFTNPTLRMTPDADYAILQKIANFLQTRFRSEIDDLIYDNAQQKEECIYDGARQVIVKETDNPFKRFGIVQKSHAYKFETTVSVILRLYRLLKAEDEDLKGLLTKLHEKYPEQKYIGGWDDLTYEAWCDDFDKELEQQNFKKHLEEILEEVKEELDEIQKRLGDIEKVRPAGCKLMITIGNHDLRFSGKLSNILPQYEGIKGFDIADHTIHWKWYWSIMVNQTCMIKHRWHNGVHAVYNNTMKSGTSFVSGHLHSLKITPWTDYTGTRYGVDTGTMACIKDNQFAYTENNPVNWRAGYAVLTYINGKLMPPELAEVINEDEGLIYFRGQLLKV